MMNDGKRGISEPPFRHVSEDCRERETTNYCPFLRDYYPPKRGDGVATSQTLSTSEDVILSALAQLGAYQTGTSRSLISLFDSDYQYIVAEATPDQPVQSSFPSASCPEALWLCGTSIPRKDGVCELSLLGELPTSEHTEELELSQSSRELPLTLAQDLCTDSRFCYKPYCQGKLARFYAAVPIRTKRGINIGVYCVIDETPGKSWNDEHTGRLRNISMAIMDHLEARRADYLHRRDVRMNRGLGSFIEGSSTLSGWRSGPNIAAFGDKIDQEGALSSKQQTIQRKREDSESGISISQSSDNHLSSAERAFETRMPAASDEDSIRHSQVNFNLPRDENANHVFPKVANIIRESVEVEGCFFFDAKMGTYRPSGVGVQTKSGTTSSSDDSINAESEELNRGPCQLLGFSTSTRSSLDESSSQNPGVAVAEKFLARLLRRYPKGKIFNFGKDGRLQPSDSSENDGGSGSIPVASRNKPQKTWSREYEGALILEMFPEARSVAFVPVWDPRNDRWCAGGFVYTNLSNRTFTALGELSYLRAFGMLAAAEILRFEAIQADKAKADILGSLSHELRSPLHGVLLSAELLNDTNLNVLQGNAAYTIEVCCRTLLDTIDHLLDYSKINSYAANTKKTQRGDAGSITARGDADLWGKNPLLANCRLDRLVEEVVESVFSGFKFEHSSSKRSAALQDELHPPPREVLIRLKVDAQCNWAYCVQVGAICRIIMNLFGNALKYTDHGMVEVSLTQETVYLKRRKKEHVVTLTVQDTGRGIGTDFLQNKLFKPFSQESSLVPGTGLGLSLVKQIISQLQGRISIKSEVGVGTCVSVALPLDQVLAQPDTTLHFSEEDEQFEADVRDLTRMRVRLRFPDRRTDTAGLDLQASLESTCLEWLHMQVIPSGEEGVMEPELILWSDKVLPTLRQNIDTLAHIPNVVVCSDPFVAYELSKTFATLGYSGIFEFISQPIGPRKLARALRTAYERWTSLSDGSSAEASLGRRLDLPRPSPSSLTVSIINSPTPKEALSPLHINNSARTAMESSSTQPYAVPDTLTSSTSDSKQFPSLEDALESTRLLLVDDNNINLKVLSNLMKKLGLKYSLAVNGKEAVDAFIREPLSFECILMDISMPVMDGFEATRIIRTHECQNGMKSVPIIALSGLGTEDAQREALGSGMDHFLTKPVKMKLLKELLSSKGILNTS